LNYNLHHNWHHWRVWTYAHCWDKFNYLTINLIVFKTYLNFFFMAAFLKNMSILYVYVFLCFLYPVGFPARIRKELHLILDSICSVSVILLCLHEVLNSFCFNTNFYCFWWLDVFYWCHMYIAKLEIKYSMFHYLCL